MIVIASTIPRVQKWLEQAFQQHAPADAFCLMGSEQAQYASTAAAWFPDLAALDALPELKLIHSMAAGVEHLQLERMELRYQVCRVIDAHHQKGMWDYLHWCVLYYQRYFDQALVQQKQQRWRQYPQRDNSDQKIAIMGLGHMGGYMAQQFAALGYAVFGWSLSAKTFENVKCYIGPQEQDAFLAQADILINLLPLTAENKGILSKELFNKLPQQACIINCGRGQHLMEQDLIHALDQERLRGAVLDVFSQEPLPEQHAFWQHEKILVTPHIASHAPQASVVAQILENDRRVQQGLALLNSVDRDKGY